MTTFTIRPDAPFSLAASAAFGFGPGIAVSWRPFCTWTAVLVRVAGDRARIPA